jgi:redox-sensitive bicupin YhaK (pirin superfamily)
LPLISGYENAQTLAPIKIHAPVNMYATYLNKYNKLDFKVHPGRQAYLVLAEGTAIINDIKLVERDALEIIGEDIMITTNTFAHIVVLEMPKV